MILTQLCQGATKAIPRAIPPWDSLHGNGEHDGCLEWRQSKCQELICHVARCNPCAFSEEINSEARASDGEGSADVVCVRYDERELSFLGGGEREREREREMVSTHSPSLPPPLPLSLSLSLSRVSHPDCTHGFGAHNLMKTPCGRSRHSIGHRGIYSPSVL